MENELVPLDLYGAGDLAPYAPGLPTLAPLSPAPDFTAGEVDLLRDYAHQETVSLLGMPISEQMIRDGLDALIKRHEPDWELLNQPRETVHFAIRFFQRHAFELPHEVVPCHDFKLGEFEGDWLIIKLANYMMTRGGSKQQRQAQLDNAIEWLVGIVQGVDYA